MSRSEQSDALSAAIQIINDATNESPETFFLQSNRGDRTELLIQTIQMAIKGILTAQERHSDKVAAILEMHSKVSEMERALDQRTAANKRLEEEISLLKSSTRKRAFPEKSAPTNMNQVSSRLRSSGLFAETHEGTEQNVLQTGIPHATSDSQLHLFTHHAHLPPLPYFQEIDVHDREPERIFPISPEQWQMHDGTDRDFAIRLVGSDPICHVPVEIPGFSEKQFSIQLVVHNGRNMLHVRNMSETDDLIVAKTKRRLRLLPPQRGRDIYRWRIESGPENGPEKAPSRDNP